MYGQDTSGMFGVTSPNDKVIYGILWTLIGSLVSAARQAYDALCTYLELVSLSAVEGCAKPSNLHYQRTKTGDANKTEESTRLLCHDP